MALGSGGEGCLAHSLVVHSGVLLGDGCGDSETRLTAMDDNWRFELPRVAVALTQAAVDKGHEQLFNALTLSC